VGWNELALVGAQLVNGQLPRFGAGRDSPGLSAVTDLLEAADGRKDFTHGLNLQVTGIDAVQHNVHHLKKKHA